jgi:hypothetical protein
MSNKALALSIAFRLLNVVLRAEAQGRDVSDEEMDGAMDRSKAATGRVEDLADRDNIDIGGNNDS